MNPTVLTRQQALARLTAPGEPYELIDKVVGDQRLRVFRHAPASLRSLFAATVSEATFLVYQAERLSFAQAHGAASALAHHLVTVCGVAKGDRVAIAMRNYPEWVHAFVATTSIGAIAVAMNAWWQPEEMAYGLQDSGAKVLLADGERLERLSRIGPVPGLRVIGVRTTQLPPGATDLAEILSTNAGEAMPEVEVDGEDPATIFYTSGSTGHPKGVLATHRSILSALLSWELDGKAGILMSGIEPAAPAQQIGTLLAVPLFHATGSHAAYLSCYRAQRKMVCMYRWDPEEAARLIEHERVTSFIAPAAMTGDLVRVARETRRDLSSLVAVGGGGAPRAPEQVRQIGSSFVAAMPNTGWGMTETNAIGTSIGGPDYLEHPASSGRCSAVLDLKVVDDHGRAVPAGERGELLVRGASMFSGYWNRSELNATLFEDGWFRTGDVAFIDADGYLTIVDRIKDLIIRGGENIGCGQVEAALLMHPDVLEAAVYAVPDDRLGEEVAATVHARSSVDAEALQSFLGEHLARFEVPRYITITDQPLPRTASGKILKRQLRDEAVGARPIDTANTSPAP